MILIVGAGGQLGARFVAEVSDAIGLTRADLDLATAPKEVVFARISEIRPSLVINCSAFNAVDLAESEPELCRQINTTAVGWLAEAAVHNGAGFLTFSTDFVFSGTKDTPYLESDQPGPLSVYGASKLAGEVAALAAGDDVLVARTAWLAAPGRSNFVTKVLDRAGQGPFDVVDDQFGSPTFVADLVESSLAAMQGGWRGLLHLAGVGQVSRYELAQATLAAAGLDPALVRPVPASRFQAPAARPANSALVTIHELPVPMPPWEPSLRTLVSEHTVR